jgi:hypothetical protein
MKNMMMVLVLLMATHASAEVVAPENAQQNPDVVSAACVLKVSHNLRKLYTATRRAVKKMDKENEAYFKKNGEAKMYGMNERAQARLLGELNDSLLSFAEGKEEVLKDSLIKELCDNDLKPFFMYKD